LSDPNWVDDRCLESEDDERMHCNEKEKSGILDEFASL
jgi:hypothetical protein